MGNRATRLAVAKNPSATNRFQNDVLRGLSMPRKRFLSKYLYDERGSRLFEEITRLEEYYLTNAELEIMHDHSAAMADEIGPAVTLIEFGSGNSQKTRSLLKELRDPAAYVPVDISIQQLHKSAAKLATRYPDIEVLPVCADFTRRFRVPEGSRQPWRRVVYFPGSTIGNFTPRRSLRLLGRIARTCGLGGAVLIGVDLQKDREVIEAAYNDAQGVTAAFNLNLLARVNRELDADFNLRQFAFQADYNPPQEAR